MMFGNPNSCIFYENRNRTPDLSNKKQRIKDKFPHYIWRTLQQKRKLSWMIIMKKITEEKV